LSTALRWAFLTDAQLDTLLPGRDQGVLFVSTTDGRVVAAMRWDKSAGRVVSLDVIVPPEPVEGDLEPFSSVWWGGISNAANFPKKTENNEQYIGSAPMPHDAQEIVRSVDFKRELFLDGPGWLLSGAPSLKSLVVDLLDPRGQDQAGDPFPATVTVDGTALTAGQDFGTTTVVSYSDIRQGTLSQVALRLLWIPAHVLAS